MSNIIVYNSIGIICSQYIPHILTGINNILNDMFISSITIDRIKSIRGYAVGNYLDDQLQCMVSRKKIHGNNYSLVDGYYNILFNFDNNSKKNIKIKIQDTTIQLYMFIDFWSVLTQNISELHRNNMIILEQFIEQVYKKSMNTTQFLIQHFLQENGKWSSPIINEHRNISNLTSEMQTTIDKVGKFINDKNDYDIIGKPYRLGLLLCGGPGTGKTTTAEYIAQKFHMEMYCINLISHKMSDNLLIQTCISVPKNSLIIIDEFDKVYSQILLNKKTKITIAGILNALDGPIRLPSGCIIIVIMNRLPNEVIVDEIHRNAFIRKGRLDICVEFNTLYDFFCY